MLSLWANWLQVNSQLNSTGVSFWLYRRICLIVQSEITTFSDLGDLSLASFCQSRAEQLLKIFLMLSLCYITPINLQKTVEFFQVQFHQDLSSGDKLEFLNLWYVLIILSDAFTMAGSIHKILIEIKVSVHTSVYIRQCTHSYKCLYQWQIRGGATGACPPKIESTMFLKSIFFLNHNA